jgi:hypothetical protein
MQLLSRLGISAFLVAVAVLPRPGMAADPIHPLDPAAPSGPVPTQNVFQGHVPLLDRDSPAPSFTDEGDQPEAEEPARLPEAMDHGAMDHGAAHAPPGEEP